MLNSIFCPKNHLILNATRCAECDWERPIPGEVGELAWGPLNLEVSLGGPGRGMAAIPAITQGIVVFSLRNGELVGIALADGTIRWRMVLDAGMMTRHIVADGECLLASIADERQIGAAENARLVSINSKDGEITTLWEADGHQLTPPYLSANHILVWSSSHDVVALSRQEKPRELWRQKMNTWWSLPPYIAGERVLVSDGRAMHGEGELVALNLTDGERLWGLPMDGMLTQPPTALGEVLVFLNGRKQLVGLDLRNGKIIWQQDFKRIYSAPIPGDGLVYLTVRGTAGSGEVGHYLILGLDPESGDLKFEIPLPINARARMGIIQEGTLYLGTDDGRILAYRLPDGQLLWAFDFHPDEEKSQDKIHTGLVIDQGVLTAGTYFGELAALRVAATRSELKPPHAYMEDGDFEGAAAAFALEGDLQQAANVYAEKLQEYDKAFAIYDYAKLYEEAGELARSIGDNMVASGYFKKADNRLEEAKSLESAGDLLGAALIYADIRDLKTQKRAADLFEELGEHRKALDMHFRLGNLGKAILFFGKVIFTTNDVEILEEKGHLSEAAQVAMKIKSYAKAAKLYEQIDDHEKALEALQKLVEIEPENDWAWEQISQVAKSLGRLSEVGETALSAGLYDRAIWFFAQAGDRERELEVLLQIANKTRDNDEAWHRISQVAKSLGRFENEAQAWVYFKNYWDAADAYHRAALQAEILTPENHERIAHLFEQAQHFFGEMGLNQECQQCQVKIVYYRKLPQVIIEGRTQKAFREGEFNLLMLHIQNVGRGVALNVRVQLGGARFEMDESAMHLLIKNIGPGRDEIANISLRPYQDQVGDAVPMQLEWVWLDRKGNEYREQSTTYVQVKARDASRTGGSPQEIHYHGTVYQGESVEVVGGDRVDGDQIKGDKVESGAQKGDKVEINRGQGVRLSETKKKQTGPLTDAGPACPTCHLPVDAGDQFCQACGNKIQATD